MKTYEFTVILSGTGKNINRAWEDAQESFSRNPGIPHSHELIEGTCDCCRELKREETCDDCGEEKKTFMKDIDGTNLEETYGCPKCDG